MPNWVKNIVTLSPEAMKTVQQKYFTDGNLDFNKIVPMPETLNLTSGTITGGAVAYAITLKNPKEQDEIVQMLHDSPHWFAGNQLSDLMIGVTGERVRKYAKEWEPGEAEKKLGISTLEELGDTYIKNIKEYGCQTWYDWCIENWDTKWNACECIVTDTTVEFDTAWSTPEAVFEALSEALPGETINVKYADEDIGSNCGELEFANGELKYENMGNEAFAYEVWGIEDIGEELEEGLSLGDEAKDACQASQALSNDDKGAPTPGQER